MTIAGLQIGDDEFVLDYKRLPLGQGAHWQTEAPS